MSNAQECRPVHKVATLLLHQRFAPGLQSFGGSYGTSRPFTGMMVICISHASVSDNKSRCIALLSHDIALM